MAIVSVAIVSIGALRSVDTSGLPTTATPFCSLLRNEPSLPSAARQISPLELVHATWPAGTWGGGRMKVRAEAGGVGQGEYQGEGEGCVQKKMEGRVTGRGGWGWGRGEVRVAGTLASWTSSEAAPRLAEPAPWKRKRSPRASATSSVHCGLHDTWRAA